MGGDQRLSLGAFVILQSGWWFDLHCRAVRWHVCELCVARSLRNVGCEITGMCALLLVFSSSVGGEASQACRCGSAVAVCSMPLVVAAQHVPSQVP
jgi:hypothetical protein